jgi:tRNA modification GTPase
MAAPHCAGPHIARAAVTSPDTPDAKPDTIAAIATGPSPGGIGVIRLSGPDAAAIAHALTGVRATPRHAHYVACRDGAGALLDRGLLLHFPAPHSYTGEDVVELQLHGSPPLLRCVLQRLFELGARPARPGEFTERAFLEGKLDLAQAEAVADLISAGSEAAARAALRSLDGDFSRAVDALLRALVALRVQVEAAIDFPEEEIDFLGDGRIAAVLADVSERHAMLLAEARRGQRLRDGLHVVIVGPPNAGKSSLLNALAGSERAIVTATPGTTRDLLRETVQLDGIELTLVDTAGLRAASADPIEIEGMRRARAELARADLVLAVVEAGDLAAPAALARELTDAGAAPAAMLVRVDSKIDLHDTVARRDDLAGTPSIALSATTGAGLPLLRELLRERAGLAGGAGAWTARARHLAALDRVGNHLDEAAAQLSAGLGELVAEELRLAQHVLGTITGTFDADALLGEIFSSFCIGK